MCGITGIAWNDPSRPVDPDVLDRMTDILAHRGPNGRGTHLEPGVGLGMRRLAIIDPVGGDQPIANEDGSVVVICNGEIYDHVETRRELEARGHRFATGSDTEVLVHLYEEHGLDLVDRLRGMFAFALWDRRRRRLVLARDRIGIKPLHVAETDDALLFGSEAKAILESGLVEPSLEREALADLLSLGAVRSPLTLFRGVRELEPGQMLIREDGRSTLRRYWSIDFPDDGEWDERTPEAWAEAFMAELDMAVRLRLRSDVPLGAWLSAGLDSSVVTALMDRHLDGGVDTFSVRFDDPSCDEFEERRALFDFPGFDLRSHQVWCRDEDIGMLPRAVWHMEDPSAYAISIPRMLKSELASERVRVVLAGEGADELLGGYRRYQADESLRRVSALMGAVRAARDGGSNGERGAAGGGRKAGGRVARLLAQGSRMTASRFATMIGPDTTLLGDGLLAHLEGPAQPRPDLPNGVERERYERWHPFNQIQAWDLGVRLPDSILRHVDRASMAYGLEVRVPFLDHRILELCARMPPEIMSPRTEEKRVLREGARGLVPEEIRTRRKWGLRAPDDTWMRSALPERARHLLSPEVIADRGWFRPEAVERIGRAHRAGEGRGGPLLMAVLGVQLWDDIFLRGGDRGPQQG